jgi:hypothetical protein
MMQQSPVSQIEHTALPTKVKRSKQRVVQVDPSDFIMQPGFNAAPIVVEKYKFIFFTIRKNGCTVWKQNTRRMMGYEDWRTKEPAFPGDNGLVYLHHYNLSQATMLMNSPDYTRAIFVRDPKERFLSAFLDKAVQQDYFEQQCCQKRLKRKVPMDVCREKSQTFNGFVKMTRLCKDTHWGPQWKRMEAKYFQTLDFVGHLETAAQDAKRLLQKIGAWEEHGKSGWGLYGNESIFESTSFVKHKTGNGTTDSRDRLSKYYTLELDTEIEERFARDYTIPEYGLALQKIQYPAVTRHPDTTRQAK